jgi:hypothetical protein
VQGGLVVDRVHTDERLRDDGAEEEAAEREREGVRPQERHQRPSSPIAV